MEILSQNLLLGDFLVSNYGLTVGSFSYSGDSDDDIGMNITTIEEFIGQRPVPVYLGQQYTDKLHLQITLVKNPCVHDEVYFSEKDCRGILRALTGKRGYQWLKLITAEADGDLWYRARMNNLSYKRIGGRVCGIVLNLECDSCFAWSDEYTVTTHAKANEHFHIYNNTTDDLNNYVYPWVNITSFSTGTVAVTNISDKDWISEIKNVRQNEEIIIDSKRQIISSNSGHDLLLNDFNLGWFRLLPDKNEYVSRTDIIITMKYRVPRKVGVIE